MALDFTRKPGDGRISAEHTDDGRILIEHGDDLIALSPFNAARLLVCLSMVLDLPLTKASLKAIKT